VRRWLIPVVLLAVLASCSTKYIKFPAEEYLVRYWKDRQAFQDETYPGRKKCDRVRAALIAPGTGVPVVLPTPAKIEELRLTCDRLADRLAEYDRQDLIVIRASLKGDTIDKESVDNLRNLAGPILGLVADVMKGAAL